MVQEWGSSLVEHIQHVIQGKQEIIQLLVYTFLAKGHVLLEDVPGVGKTMLARSFAQSMAIQFQRIQFTPDLLPSDITGLSIFNRKENDFVFKPGPIFTDVLLADEINRATPRTQSALLEAMGEKQVTIDGYTHLLSPFFFVVATQNPIEFEGTFPLPEAQMDRFMTRLSLGYPGPEDEMNFLKLSHQIHPIYNLQAVTDKKAIESALEQVEKVHVSDSNLLYMARIAEATRKHPSMTLGISPRGSLATIQMAKARAAWEGRDFILPDDIKYLLPFTSEHRMSQTMESRIKKENLHKILLEILSTVEVPV
jgi:MoxR-like ATPase